MTIATNIDPTARAGSPDTTPVSPRGRTGPRWAGYAAAVWSLLYMLPHLYWALGGGAMLALVRPSAPSLPEWRLINAVASVMLTGAALIALALVRSPRRRVLRRPLLAVAWAGAVLSVAHGLYGITDRALIVAGITLVESRPFSVDEHGWVLWDMLLIEPWFLVEGVLFGLTGLAALDGARERRRWLWLCALGVAAALVAAVLQVRVA